MASLTQWTWVWVNSGSWWWTLSPGMLLFMGSLESDTTEWSELNWRRQKNCTQKITTPMKEIKDDINRWRDIPNSWVGRINIVKMTILTKVIYRYSTILVKLPIVLFTELQQVISWFVQKHERTWIAEAILRTKKGVGRIHLPDFRLYYKVTFIKTVLYWHKNRNIYQWNKIESPEINPCTYSTLSLVKEVRIYSTEKTVSSTSGAG